MYCAVRLCSKNCQWSRHQGIKEESQRSNPMEADYCKTMLHNYLCNMQMFKHKCTRLYNLLHNNLFLPAGLLEGFCPASDTSQKQITEHIYQPTTHPQHRHHRCMGAETKNTNPKLNMGYLLGRGQFEGQVRSRD